MHGSVVWVANVKQGNQRIDVEKVRAHLNRRLVVCLPSPRSESVCRSRDQLRKLHSESPLIVPVADCPEKLRKSPFRYSVSCGEPNPALRLERPRLCPTSFSPSHQIIIASRSQAPTTSSQIGVKGSADV